MHEVSLVTSLVDQVIESSYKHHFKRVKTIHLAIGEWSGVLKEAVDFCFPEISKNTILEGAKLEYSMIPLKIFCSHCQKEQILVSDDEPYDLHCPLCHGSNVKISEGKEFKIIDLEVIDE